MATGMNIKDTADQYKIESDLMKFAVRSGFKLKEQNQISLEAIADIESIYGKSPDNIKVNFDDIVSSIEDIAYRIYLKEEEQFGSGVLSRYAEHLVSEGRIRSLDDVGKILGENFRTLDRFFLSIAQSRKSRAGRAFEETHNYLFRKLSYPFSDQAVINGKPDFLLPSKEHYATNAMDCIIFTAKRTLRERWRQIVTEGTRGLGFYLATIDENISGNQIREMQNHRIYVVVPSSIKVKCYPDYVNAISFRQFFSDHLDPAMARWRRNGVI